MHAALDAIKRKRGYTGFHLVGQSGGGTLVSGLLIVRDDIGCAVPGAAHLGLYGRPFQHPLLQYLDPIREARRIASRRSTRIIVITDPEDRQVVPRYQIEFAYALQRAGARMELHYVHAGDEKRHQVLIYAAQAIARCIKGESREQIAAALAIVQQRVLAAIAARRSAGGTPPSRG